MEECRDLGLEKSALQLRQISHIIHFQGGVRLTQTALQSQAGMVASFSLPFEFQGLKSRSRIRLMRGCRLGILSLLSLPAVACLAQVTAVRAQRMLDVKTGRYVSNAVVLVEGDKIIASGSGLTIPANETLRSYPAPEAT
jgi:hypothetical protein